MGKTNISWTDFTWNPWMGCRKVSLGCKNCYMFRDQERYGNDPTEIRRSKTTFDEPLKWKDPAMVFVNSWSDFFIEEADDWRDDAWDIIRRTPQLTYQILTKRPENIPYRLPRDWGDGWDNVWLGISIERSKEMHRGFTLAHIITKHRFISAEPLIGQLNLWMLLGENKFEWVIVGGESGFIHRNMNLAWVRAIKKQCDGTGVAFFMKQDSGPKPGMRGRIPDDLWIQEFPDIEKG